MVNSSVADRRFQRELMSKSASQQVSESAMQAELAQLAELAKMAVGATKKSFFGRFSAKNRIFQAISGGQISRYGKI
jgi:hypothetical protein